MSVYACAPFPLPAADGPGSSTEYTTAEGSVLRRPAGPVHHQRQDPAHFRGDASRPPSAPPPAPTPSWPRTSSPPTVAGARFFELKTVQKMDGAELAACVSRPLHPGGGRVLQLRVVHRAAPSPRPLRSTSRPGAPASCMAKGCTAWAIPTALCSTCPWATTWRASRARRWTPTSNGMMDAAETPSLPGVHRRAPLELFPAEKDAYIDAISPQVSRSVTVSTLHGCPPEEIERIATYLIDGKGAAHLRQVQPHPAGL